TSDSSRGRMVPVNFIRTIPALPNPLHYALLPLLPSTMARFSPPAVTGPLTALGVFLFFAAMFAIPSGYSYGGALLLLTSLVFLARRPDFSHVGREDWSMIGVLFAYFSVSAIMVWLLGNNLTDIDQYARALLAIPILRSEEH